MPDAINRETESTTDSSLPDYSGLEIPQDKPPSEYTYHERRARILEIILHAGHPSAISQVELADHFDVAQSTISRDIDRLEESIRAHLARRRDLKIGSALDRALRGALDDEDWEATRRIAETYHEYMDDRLGTLEFRARLDRLEDIADRGGR